MGFCRRVPFQSKNSIVCQTWVGLVIIEKQVVLVVQITICFISIWINYWLMVSSESYQTAFTINKLGFRIILPGTVEQEWNTIPTIIISVWWLTNHLEKYEFVNGKDDLSHIWNGKKHVWNHQPDIICALSFHPLFVPPSTISLNSHKTFELNTQMLLCSYEISSSWNVHDQLYLHLLLYSIYIYII